MATGRRRLILRAWSEVKAMPLPIPHEYTERPLQMLRQMPVGVHDWVEKQARQVLCHKQFGLHEQTLLRTAILQKVGFTQSAATTAAANILTAEILARVLEGIAHPGQRGSSTRQTRATSGPDISSWGDSLNSIGDDAQLANVDLQNMLQKQQQTLQMLSNISKSDYDTAMDIIRKIGG
jgi:hypothetical protein